MEETGQQIISGTSPPTNRFNYQVVNHDSTQPVLNQPSTLSTLTTLESKRVYSSKSKSIHYESVSANQSSLNGIHNNTVPVNSHHSNNNGIPLQKQTIVMNGGNVFPIQKQPNYFFPPFPSPNSNQSSFVIPPFPSLNSSLTSSNTLMNTNMNQVDMLMNQSGYSTSSSSPNSAHCVTPQIDMEKSNLDSIPIKKRKKKGSPLSDSSNQIDEEEEEPINEKKRQRGSDDMNRQKEKKERRLVRNRQSAQASRERKKLYIQTLEEKVSNLEQKIKLLEDENALLRRQVI